MYRSHSMKWVVASGVLGVGLILSPSRPQFTFVAAQEPSAPAKTTSKEDGRYDVTLQKGIVWLKNQKADTTQSTKTPGGKIAKLIPMLDRPSGLKSLYGMTLETCVTLLSDKHGTRFGIQPFSRDILATENSFIAINFNELKLVSFTDSELTLRELLDEVAIQLSMLQKGISWTIVVQGNGIFWGLKYTKPSSEEESSMIDPDLDRIRRELEKGPSISYYACQKPLGEVIDDLRDLTGMNIIVDLEKEKLAAPVDLMLNNATVKSILEATSRSLAFRVQLNNNILYITK